jgi:hypothetical protein
VRASIHRHAEPVNGVVADQERVTEDARVRAIRRGGDGL